MANKGV